MSTLSDAISALNPRIKTVKDSAEWTWGLLQGDFNEEQTTSQVITNTGISITLTTTGVGIVAAWLMDLRDLLACCYLIYKDGSQQGAFNPTQVSIGKWLLCLIMLIGFVPALGDLLKGVLRLVYLQFQQVIKQFPHLPVRQQFGRAIDASFPYIEQLLNHEKVRTYLLKRGWNQPYAELAKGLKAHYTQITSLQVLSAKFTENINKAAQMFDQVKRWLPASAEAQFLQLLNQLNAVKKGLDQSVGRLTKPLQECIDELIIRLEKRDMLLNKAPTGQLSSHYYGRITDGSKAYQEAKKLPFLKAKAQFEPLKPDQVVKTAKHQEALRDGWMPLSDSQIKTFSERVSAITLKGPQTLYRVIDPESNAAGIYWMTEKQFKRLSSRQQWRDRFAVKVEWSANGQVVTYELKDDERLKVWAGPAASQAFIQGSNGPYYTGGKTQLVFAPDVKRVSARKETGWGYVDNDQHLLANRVVINVDGTTP